jgi:hypothetical protein
MILFEETEVVGWRHAIRGMRNPKNSWDKSDSFDAYDCAKCGVVDRDGICNPKEHNCEPFRCYEIGPNDSGLMTTLRNAGTDHRKFMRMIVVYVDITAPLYWWKEFDTYKVGTVANSCSTMHKIHAKEFTVGDFSTEHLTDDSLDMLENHLIFGLNSYRKDFLETRDKKNWWQLIQMLPSSYNQKRTIMLNYEVLANMYHSRKNHKLDEWREFCSWIESLPYSEFITGGQLDEVHG